MLRFMAEGGATMWGVLVLGLVALGAAVRFVRRPEPGALAPIRALGWAVAGLMVAGTLVNVATVTRAAGERTQAGEAALPVLLFGAAEAVAPLVLGSTLLALTAFVCALGLRRLTPAAR